MSASRAIDLFRPGVLALGLLGYVIIGAAAVAYPYDLGMYEGVVFMPAIRLLSGHAVFGASAALNPPYDFPLYGPLYYLGLGTALKVTGVAFWPGRLLSVICGLGVALLVFRHARRSGLDSDRSLLVANVFLMVPSAWTFFTLQRVDAPSLLLAALGALLMLERRGLWVALVSGVLFALAALTKPAVCGLFLGSVALRVFERRRIEAAACALSASLTFLGVVEAFRWLGLGDYLFNLFASLDGDTTVANVEDLLASVGSSPVFFVLVTFGLLELWWHIRRRRPAHESGPILLALASFLGGALLSAHTGSSSNYLLEMLFALCLAVSSSLSRGFLAQDGSRLADLLLLAAFVFESVVFHGGFIRGRLLLPEQRRPVYEALVNDLSKLSPGSTVVADLPDLVYRAGLEPWVNDIPQYTVGPAYVRDAMATALNAGQATALIYYHDQPTPGFVRVHLPSPVFDSLGRVTPDPGPFLYVRVAAQPSPSPR